MTVVNTAISAPDSAKNERLKNQRRRQRELGREIQRFYDSIVREPVPPSFAELLCESEGDHTSGGEKDGD